MKIIQVRLYSLIPEPTPFKLACEQDKEEKEELCLLKQFTLPSQMWNQLSKVAGLHVFTNFTHFKCFLKAISLVLTRTNYPELSCLEQSKLATMYAALPYK